MLNGIFPANDNLDALPRRAYTFPCVATHFQQALKELVERNFSSAADFSRACGVDQSQVWRDCRGRRVSDERFRSYLAAVNKDDRRVLLAARLHDLLPPSLRQAVRIEEPSSVAEAPDKCAFDLLSKETRQALDLLIREMGADRELSDWVVRFIRRIC